MDFIIKESAQFVPMYIVKAADFNLDNYAKSEQAWLSLHEFSAKPGQFCCLADAEGNLAKVIVGADSAWALGGLAKLLPPAIYKLEKLPKEAELFALSWALTQYQYLRYLSAKPKSIRQLLLPEMTEELVHFINATKLVRDLINTPAADLSPVELSESALLLAKQFSAESRVIVGDDLLEHGFPAIHAVGRAAPQAPRLIEIDWQATAQDLPLVTLVGKGVCFDTGGLDLKNAAGMLGMKKDMGGAANVLGLAHCIMANNLPVRLKVLIPAVENSIGRDAYRPSDIIKMRSGKTVEVTNTDAEGRLVLADAITYACEFKPDLLLDMATLTGAARVAVGTEVSAAFSDNSELVQTTLAGALHWQDPVCFLPLYKPYKKMLKSNVADISNTGKSGYAGAITAALFLAEFVSEDVAWIHFDIMAANLTSGAGRPEGGEAMGLRALYYLIKTRFAK